MAPSAMMMMFSRDPRLRVWVRDIPGLSDLGHLPQHSRHPPALPEVHTAGPTTHVGASRDTMALLGAGRGRLGGCFAAGLGMGPSGQGRGKWLQVRRPFTLTSPSLSHMKFSQPSSGGASGMNSQSAPEAKADTRARYLEGQEGHLLGAGPSSPDPRPVSPRPHSLYPPRTQPQRWNPTPTAFNKHPPWARCHGGAMPASCSQLPPHPQQPGSPLTRSAAPSPPVQRSSGGCGQEQDRGVHVEPP